MISQLLLATNSLSYELDIILWKQTRRKIVWDWKKPRLKGPSAAVSREIISISILSKREITNQKDPLRSSKASWKRFRSSRSLNSRKINLGYNPVVKFTSLILLHFYTDCCGLEILLALGSLSVASFIICLISNFLGLPEKLPRCPY